MIEALRKTNRIYLSTFNLVLYFSVFALFSLILLPLISSYVNVGGAFLRFSSLYQDLTLIQAGIFILVGLVSVLLLSFFVAALISIVKLRETLDHVKFSKAISIFPKYVTKIFIFLLIMAGISMLLGTFLDFLAVPRIITHLILFCIWLPFIFTPQVLIIEDFNITRSMDDALKFVKKRPVSLVLYIFLGFIFLFLLALLETMLGMHFIWEHKIISIVIVSLFILPYLQMFATELYIERYPVSKSRL